MWYFLFELQGVVLQVNVYGKRFVMQMFVSCAHHVCIMWQFSMLHST